MNFNSVRYLERIEILHAGSFLKIRIITRARIRFPIVIMLIKRSINIHKRDIVRERLFSILSFLALFGIKIKFDLEKRSGTRASVAGEPVGAIRTK